ncbi:MAG: ribose-5-phosphate isomerase rki1 [Trizodia sp. TS-e1964]|nr:MAG: ribose-5-phosphate isomerase rki1 [Trizodia sp. TS-e1964]
MPSPEESAKRQAAYSAVAAYFEPHYTLIGIGSGSTIVYVVEAIAARPPAVTSAMRFVPTGAQSKELILAAGLRLEHIDSLPPGPDGAPQLIDVAFDGADEVDEDRNCIKGGGACLFQEKLVATNARRFVVVADYRKSSGRLLTSWPSIPIEVCPGSESSVLRALRALGSKNPIVRSGLPSKAGPCVTDNGFHIIDAPFNPLMTKHDVSDGKLEDQKLGVWTVENLARQIKMIVGVLEVGIFCGQSDEAEKDDRGGGQKPLAVFFGMQTGKVKIRTAAGEVYGEEKT